MEGGRDESERERKRESGTGGDHEKEEGGGWEGDSDGPNGSCRVWVGRKRTMPKNSPSSTLSMRSTRSTK